MTSFMGVSPGADQSDSLLRLLEACPDSGLCRVISYTIFILSLTCGLLAGRHTLESSWAPPEPAHHIYFQPLSPSASLRQFCLLAGWSRFALNDAPWRGLRRNSFSSKIRGWSFNGQLRVKRGSCRFTVARS